MSTSTIALALRIAEGCLAMAGSVLHELADQAGHVAARFDPPGLDGCIGFDTDVRLDGLDPADDGYLVPTPREQA